MIELLAIAPPKLSLKPISMQAANAFVDEYHRHNHKVAFGPRFAISVIDENNEIWGVAIVSPPVARLLYDDGYCAEVRRVCTKPNAPKNCCSMLYAACWRAWRAMGGNRMVTYTLDNEIGSSVKAAGWKIEALSSRGKRSGSNQGWDTQKRNRQQTDFDKVIQMQDKYRWEVKIP